MDTNNNNNYNNNVFKVPTVFKIVINVRFGEKMVL